MKYKIADDDAIKIFKWILATKSEILFDQDPSIDDAMLRLARAYHNSSRWKEAIPLYEKVIERRENRICNYGFLTFDEKRSLIFNESGVYGNVAISYYADNNFLDAFRVLVRGKSRLLIDFYSEQLVKSSGILEEEKVLKLNEYKSGFINYANRIEDAFRSGDEKARFNLETEQRNLMNEYAAYKESLQNKYPKYKTVSQANKLDFEHDKNFLPDDTAFVEFMVGNSAIWVFMFDKTGDIKAVEIDMPKNFLSKCSLCREFLAHFGLQTTQEVSANDKKFNEQRKSLSKYLSEIMYEAGEKNSKLIDRQDLFAMGNAFYGGNDTSASRKNLNDFSKDQRGKFDVADLKELKWDNLAGTKEEINRASKMFAAKKIFSEKAASESNLKLSNRRGNLSNYKYFLFATHGIFMSYAPEYSSIVLSQGTDSKEDGYVTVGEWMGLDLNSDLVFLSACESGLGEYQAGEGIIGISYALTVAGNKNTIMSLWKVYDTATAEFVSTFFKKISNGKSAVIALNETKREFLKHNDPFHRSPSVWAAFPLYGF